MSPYAILISYVLRCGVDYKNSVFCSTESAMVGCMDWLQQKDTTLQGRNPAVDVAGEVVKLEKDLGGAYKANPNYAWQRAVSPRPRNGYRVASLKVTGRHLGRYRRPIDNITPTISYKVRNTRERGQRCGYSHNLID